MHIDDGQLHVACICRVFIHTVVTYNYHIHTYTNILYIQYYIYSISYTQRHTRYSRLCSPRPATWVTCHYLLLAAVSQSRATPTSPIPWSTLPDKHVWSSEISRLPREVTVVPFRWIFGKFSTEPGVFNQAAFRSWTLIHVASGFFSDLWDEGSMRYIIMTWWYMV